MPAISSLQWGGGGGGGRVPVSRRSADETEAGRQRRLDVLLLPARTRSFPPLLLSRGGGEYRPSWTVLCQGPEVRLVLVMIS